MKPEGKKTQQAFDSTGAAFSLLKDPSFNCNRYKKSGNFWKALKFFKKYYNQDLTLKTNAIHSKHKSV